MEHPHPATGLFRKNDPTAVDTHAGGDVLGQEERSVQVGVIQQRQQLRRGGDADRRFGHATDHGLQAQLPGARSIRRAGVRPPHFTSFTFTP